MSNIGHSEFIIMFDRSILNFHSLLLKHLSRIKIVVTTCLHFLSWLMAPISKTRRLFRMLQNVISIGPEWDGWKIWTFVACNLRRRFDGQWNLYCPRDFTGFSRGHLIYATVNCFSLKCCLQLRIQQALVSRIPI